MDKDKAKELSNILLAYSQGKTIQRELNKIDSWQDIKELKGEDIKQATIKLMGDYFNLRIKPEPKLVPFTFEDNKLLQGKYICRDGFAAMHKIIGIDCNGISLIHGGKFKDLSYNELSMFWKFSDLSPCGKYVNE